MKMLGLMGVLAAVMPVTAMAQGAGVTPGQWETTVTINSVNMPGQPAMIANMMTGKTTKVKHCITPEEAARGPQDMLKSNKSCNFTRFSMTGGKMNSEMTCKMGANTMTAVTTGSFTPTGYTATARTVQTGAMPMTMTSSSTGRLIGPCKK